MLNFATAADRGQVVDQAVKDDQARFDVVDVDDKVVATLLARRTESFRKRFQKYGKRPPLKSESAIPSR